MSAPFPTERLRPALEAAMRVAKSGEEADPVEQAPPSLRRYLNFARLPTAALVVVRRTLDEDAEFRQRVIEASSAEEAGEAGWQWLTREEGWEERLSRLAEEADKRHRDKSEQRAERSALRQVEASEEARRRAEATAARHAEQAREARVELDAERARRRLAEQAAEALRAELAGAEEALTAARAELSTSSVERARLVAENDQIRRQLDEHGDGDGGAPAPEEPAIDRTALAHLIAAAAAALAEAASLLESPGSVAPTSRSAERTGDKTPGGVSEDRRRPVRLPGGVLDDSVEAADFLVRVPNVLLLVDGYNISNAIWPGHPLVDQRARLVDALRELQARTGAAIEVVFDGALATEPWVAGGRSRVHVRFSPPDVEADDVLIDVLAFQPASRPVVLATSDRGLRDRARRHGANLLRARQLLDAMRR